MTMLRIAATIGKVDEYTRSVMILASTRNPVRVPVLSGLGPDAKIEIQNEALLTWDLERFLKNPVILWAHDNCAIPIGKASEIEIIPQGLRMRVTFARAAVSELAEAVYQGVIDDMIRAVSVGFEPGTATTKNGPGGEQIVERTANLLLEVSFVPVPADEDAGTAALNPAAAETPEEAQRRLGSEAARALAMLRGAGKPHVLVVEHPDGSTTKTDHPSKAAAQKAAADHLEKNGGTGKLVIAPKGKEDTVKPVPAQGGNRPAGPHPSKDEGKDGKGSGDDKGGGGGGEPDRDDGGRFDQLRFDRGGRLDKAKRTSLGGALVPARISRVGVLSYRLADGTMRRELRHPDEVFKADSLRTLEDVPVIDIRDHTAILSTDDYRRVSLGHVKTYRHDAKFVESDLVIQDAPTLDAIDAGERTEISCGYVCKLDMTPGIYDGEPYDCVQRNIRYNHVALCPPNRGRAGPEVGLRLDNKAHPWGVSQLEEESIMTVKIKLAGKEYEVGSEAHLDKIDEMNKSALEQARLDAQTKLDAVMVDLAAEKKRADEAEGRRDALDTELKQIKLDAKARADKEVADKETEKTEYKRARKFRRRLERMIARFFGDKAGKGASADEDDDEKDDEKMDAMTDRELMLEAIKSVTPTFDAKDKSDDYVSSRFDAIVESLKSDRGVDGVVRAAQREAGRLDATTDDDIAAKRAERDKAAAEAWKKK